MIGEALAFFASPAGLRILAILIASSIVIWDWRYTLLTLFVMQGAVGAATLVLTETPREWVLIQSAVMGLACVILWMSATGSIASSPTARQSGTWWLRLMAVLLLIGGWQLLGIHVTLPEIDDNLAPLFGWMAVCALLMLGLGSNPLYGGVAILFWVVPVQAFVVMVLEAPSLVALLGILELLVALACAYLFLAEQTPKTSSPAILTDVSFPAELDYAQPSISLGAVIGTIGSTVRRRWPRRAHEMVNESIELTSVNESSVSIDENAEADTPIADAAATEEDVE